MSHITIGSCPPLQSRSTYGGVGGRSWSCVYSVDRSFEGAKRR